MRIAAATGGCNYDMIAPIMDLIEKGNLDYIIFEMLSERTMSEAYRAKLSDPSKGYSPMLEDIFEAILPKCIEQNIKIVSNMGATNTESAVKKIAEIAKRKNLKCKIAYVIGDQIELSSGQFDDYELLDKGCKVRELEGKIGANAYLSNRQIGNALREGANIVLTGRVADEAIFTGPIMKEFNLYKERNPELLGQAIVAGHLLECSSQVSGGYFANPGYQDVKHLENLGKPIAEFLSDGRFTISIPEGSGGLVDKRTCTQQLFYEITDPNNYYTPDGIADFTKVEFEEIGDNQVRVNGGLYKSMPENYKVNIFYSDGYTGFGEISYGGFNALKRAKLAAETIIKRWQLNDVIPFDYHVSFIGYDSMFGREITKTLIDYEPLEVRMRIEIKTKSEEHCKKCLNYFKAMYINGPAGSSGIFTHFNKQISVDNFLVPIDTIKDDFKIVEVN